MPKKLGLLPNGFHEVGGQKRQVVRPLDNFRWDRLRHRDHEVIIPLQPKRVDVISWEGMAGETAECGTG